MYMTYLIHLPINLEALYIKVFWVLRISSKSHVVTNVTSVQSNLIFGSFKLKIIIMNFEVVHFISVIFFQIISSGRYILSRDLYLNLMTLKDRHTLIKDG